MKSITNKNTFSKTRFYPCKAFQTGTLVEQGSRKKVYHNEILVESVEKYRSKSQYARAKKLYA